MRTRIRSTTPAVTERQLQAQVLDLAHLLGWRTYHSWTSIHSTAGFPDLVLVSADRRRVVFAELKGMRRRLTEAQDEWLGILRLCGAEAYVWRPDQLKEIAEVLW